MLTNLLLHGIPVVSSIEKCLRHSPLTSVPCNESAWFDLAEGEVTLTFNSGRNDYFFRFFIGAAINYDVVVPRPKGET